MGPETLDAQEEPGGALANSKCQMADPQYHDGPNGCFELVLHRQCCLRPFRRGSASASPTHVEYHYAASSQLPRPDSHRLDSQHYGLRTNRTNHTNGRGDTALGTVGQNVLSPKPKAPDRAELGFSPPIRVIRAIRGQSSGSLWLNELTQGSGKNLLKKT